MKFDLKSPENKMRLNRQLDRIMELDDRILFKRAQYLSGLTGRPTIDIFTLLHAMSRNPDLQDQFSKMFADFHMITKLSHFDEINRQQKNIEDRARSQVEYDIKKEYYNATKDMVLHEEKPKSLYKNTQQTENDRVISIIDQVLAETFFVEADNEHDLTLLKAVTGLELVEKGWMTKYWQFKNKDSARIVREKLIVND